MRLLCLAHSLYRMALTFGKPFAWIKNLEADAAICSDSDFVQSLALVTPAIYNAFVPAGHFLTISFQVDHIFNILMRNDPALR